mmetsp:Transcript_24338/g.60344  ORF Transcript_24338/g.60344 Transcript_24338/m.60344 type:complete len:221 (+) Transcript_24338:786-1448(+)
MCHIGFIAGSPYTWKTQRSKWTTLSSMESEYFAQTAAVTTLQAHEPLYKFLGFTVTFPIISFCDNETAVRVADDDYSTKRLKHAFATSRCLLFTFCDVMMLQEICQDDRILTIKSFWLDKILQHGKVLEIRGTPCHKLVGRRIWLRPSGHNAVTGRATLKACHGPLTDCQFKLWDALHHMKCSRLPYTRTYAWELADVKKLLVPICMTPKHGCVIWQVGQ